MKLVSSTPVPASNREAPSEMNDPQDADILAMLASNPDLRTFKCTMDVYDINLESVVLVMIAYVAASNSDDAEFIARKAASGRCQMVGLFDYLNVSTVLLPSLVSAEPVADDALTAYFNSIDKLSIEQYKMPAIEIADDREALLHSMQESANAQLPIKNALQALRLIKAKELWSRFGDVPVDDNECLELPFLDFEIGADRMDVWRWFEEHFDIEVNGLMFT